MAEFIFTHLDHQAEKILFLLHGTGGDELDLLPLVETLKDSYNIVSLRGNVSENGMNRFFARSAPGVFDQVSVQAESAKLNTFIVQWCSSHQVDTENTAYLGYSNGANMILATAFCYPELFTKAVLLHPMLPFQPTELDLSGKEFLITLGQNDQMISATESRAVVSTLHQLGAAVKTVSHEGGHEIRAIELQALQEFLTT
ncbi:MAG: alpha/beta hydrolase [bacterium]|nr:alpha/beta hydrolase [bacterium]